MEEWVSASNSFDALSSWRRQGSRDRICPLTILFLSFFQGLFIQIDYDQIQNGKTGARVGVCFKLRFNDQALIFVREEIPFMFICNIVVITATH